MKKEFERIKSMQVLNKQQVSEYSEMLKSDWQNTYSEMCKNYDIYDMQCRERILIEVHRIFNSVDMRFWLTGGSLLGAVRNSDFIAWDDDVDFDTLLEDFSSIKSILKEKMMNAGFVVRLTEDKNFPKFSFYKEGQKIALGALKKDGTWRIRPAYQYPDKMFQLNETIMFKGLNFNVPTPKEEFLEHVYGKNWMEPIKASNDIEFYNIKSLRGNRLKLLIKKALFKIRRFFL